MSYNRKKIILEALQFQIDTLLEEANSIHVPDEDMTEEEIQLRQTVKYAAMVKGYIEREYIELPDDLPLPVRPNVYGYVIQSELVLTEYFEWFQWSADGVAVTDSSDGNWKEFSIDLTEFQNMYQDCPYHDFVETCKALFDAGVRYVLVVQY